MDSHPLDLEHMLQGVPLYPRGGCLIVRISFPDFFHYADRNIQELMNFVEFYARRGIVHQDRLEQFLDKHVVSFSGGSVPLGPQAGFDIAHSFLLNATMSMEAEFIARSQVLSEGLSQSSHVPSGFGFVSDSLCTSSVHVSVHHFPAAAAAFQLPWCLMLVVLCLPSPGLLHFQVLLLCFSLLVFTSWFLSLLWFTVTSRFHTETWFAILFSSFLNPDDVSPLECWSDPFFQIWMYVCCYSLS